IEALLFQGVLELSGLFDSGAARAGLLAVLLVFTAAITALELPLAHGFLRLGRRLEGRFRIAILAKLPRLDLHYFNSRPLSDLASRAHRVHVLRGLPDIGRELIGSTVELIATAAIIVWLDPGLLLPACAAVIALLAVPLLAYPAVRERDLRLQGFDGNLTLIYLDALLGAIPVRAYDAARTIERQHDDLLASWSRASAGYHRASVAASVVQTALGTAMVVW